MILSSFLLSIIQFVFTTWFVIRTTRKYSSIFLSSKSSLTKNGTAFLCLTLIFSHSFEASSFLFFLPSAVAFVLFLILPIAFTRALKIRSSKGFQSFVEGVVLDMKCGKSLLSASRSSLSKLPQPFADFVSQKLFDPRKSPSLYLDFLSIETEKYVLDFQKIAFHNARQLDQLTHLQKQMRLDALLRHRSSQALLQTNIQCVFLVLIYICVVIYGLKTYPTHTFKPFFIASFVLLALGLLILLHVSRKRRWKT